MASKFNDEKTKEIVNAGQRICKLMPDDIADAARHIMVLVNVASKAEELRANGESIEKAVEGAARFGWHVTAEDRDLRYSNLPQKATDAANLFMNNRQLALDACDAFIRIRVNHRKLRGYGDEQDFGAEYRAAVQKIIDTVECSDDSKGLQRKETAVPEETDEIRKENNELKSENEKLKEENKEKDEKIRRLQKALNGNKKYF
jgi:FtsZ-binding cell division protein ZapB